MSKWTRRFTNFEEVLDEGLRGRHSRKVANNTYLRSVYELTDPTRAAAVVCWLHKQDIIIWRPEGITINPEHWHTRVTKERLNAFLPVRIFVGEGQDDLWFVECNGGGVVPFINGMTVDYEGNLLGIALPVPIEEGLMLLKIAVD